MGPTSSLTLFTDPTGQMTQEEINAKNIQNLLDTVNNLQESVGNILKTSTAEIANDGTSNRVVFGFQNGLKQWGLFASKAGKDALNSTNLDDFTLNSAQDAFKIVNKYTASFSVTCAAFNEFNTLFSVTHNLGYQPLYIASVNITTNTLSGSTGLFPIPYISPAGSNNTTGNNIWGFLAAVVPWTVSSTQIQFEAVIGSQNASGQTLAGTVTVYALQETAS